MVGIDDRISDIQALIQNEDFHALIPETVYLDAQAVIQWERLGVIERILQSIAPIDQGSQRFRIKGHAFSEASGKLRSLTGRSFREIQDHLQSFPNLQIDYLPEKPSSTVGGRALELQRQMFIQEGIGLPPAGSRRHMGEAESLAHIELIDPGSIFVTADNGAILVARDRRIGVPARSLALVATAVTSRFEFVELWKMLCRGRECLFAGDHAIDCVEALSCDWMSDESAERGPLNKKIRNGHDLLRMMKGDVEELVTQFD